ncbi:hypothetical protein DID88_010475 [Monilinia fructigena]|uniref:Uncharacterized protein n=1 Tax=Monilinia fructigena TaxID=38457 RepID=A0A395ILW2_9HELO|nr:hypothetical protein DID88_010475 [Monilinia fructigena]
MGAHEEASEAASEASSEIAPFPGTAAENQRLFWLPTAAAPLGAEAVLEGDKLKAKRFRGFMRAELQIRSIMGGEIVADKTGAFWTLVGHLGANFEDFLT